LGQIALVLNHSVITTKVEKHRKQLLSVCLSPIHPIYDLFNLIIYIQFKNVLLNGQIKVRINRARKAISGKAISGFD
jgi:hypothetical protein